MALAAFTRVTQGCVEPDRGVAYVAVPAEGRPVFTRGLFGALPGRRQTVPRAELYCLPKAISHAEEPLAALVTDHEHISREATKPLEWWVRKRANFDLWADISDCFRDRDTARPSRHL